MKFHDVTISGETFNLPSSTSIIGLARERKMLVGDEWLTWSDETAGFGIDTHKWVARMMRSQIKSFVIAETISALEFSNLDGSIKQCLRAAYRWQEYTRFKPREVEFEVYSVTHGFVGHPDTRGTIKQHIELIDWTTGDINTGKKIQLGSYYIAYKEMHPRRDIYGGRVVHLDKLTGNFAQEILTESDLQGYGEDFVKIREAIGVI